MGLAFLFIHGNISFIFHLRNAITLLITRIIGIQDFFLLLVLFRRTSFWPPSMIYILHATTAGDWGLFTCYTLLYNIVEWCLFQYQLLSIEYLDQLSGACHTHISNHDNTIARKYGDKKKSISFVFVPVVHQLHKEHQQRLFDFLFFSENHNSSGCNIKRDRDRDREKRERERECVCVC